jgi:hypothetical protein
MNIPEHREAIRKPGAICANCGAPLEGLPKHDSRLIVPGEPGGVEAERQDFCPGCEAEARAGLFHGRWLAQRPAPPPPTRSQTRKAQAARLREAFHRLADVADPSEDQLCEIYLLAHLLMKSGGFRWLETDDEAGVIVFEDLASGQRSVVQSVPLEPDQLGRAQERLSGLL